MLPVREGRHTCVMVLLALGVPPHVMLQTAGHSGIEVTMTVRARLAGRDAEGVEPATFRFRASRAVLYRRA